MNSTTTQRPPTAVQPRDARRHSTAPISWRATWSDSEYHRFPPRWRIANQNGSELESQTGQPWASPQKALATEPVPRCMSMDHGMPMATSHAHSMSIGSLVAPGIHPDLANDCSLMWSGVDLPLQPRPAFQSQLPESADSPFYSSPAETCPSPLSDATFSLPHSGSSISSVSVIDQYPRNIMKVETSSPLQMHTPLRWDSDAGMPPHMVPLSMTENMIQPVSFFSFIFLSPQLPSTNTLQPVQCHYPSPSWSSPDCMSYDEPVHHMHFQPVNWGM